MQLVTNNSQVSGKQEDLYLLKMLDKGIDDMEAGNEMPIEEAFQKISELRDNSRHART